MRHTWTAWGFGALLLTAGCEYSAPPSNPQASAPPVTGTVATPNQTTPAPAPAPVTGGQPATVSGVAGLAPLDATNPAPANTTPAPTPPATEQVEAKAGVTGKGNSIGGGIITEPARQYFHVRERVVFQIQIPEALKLYKASNDNKGPATHDEFWQQIVVANNLRMPKLPEGQRYVYNPETEELMVERPAPSP